MISPVACQLSQIALLSSFCPVHRSVAAACGREHRLAVAWSARYSARRAWAHKGVVVAIAGVVVVATTLLGICALLLTSTAQRGFVEAVARSDSSLQVTLSATTAPQDQLDTAAIAINELFEPVPVTQSFWAASRMSYLPRGDDGPRIGYVGQYQDVASHATLLSGRWPHVNADGPTLSPVEVVVPTAAAAKFGFAIGDAIPLSTASNEVTATVTVVGTYEASDPGGDYWSHDYLSGQGFDADARLIDSARARFLPTAGAFLAADGSLNGDAIPFDTLAVAARPDVSGATSGQILDSAASVSGAREVMRADVAPGASAFSDYPESVAAAVKHLNTTRDIVTIALLIVAALAVIALVLASTLLGHRRRSDVELLTARGASGARLVGLGIGEATVLGLVGALTGPPLAWACYAVLIRIPLAADAGLTSPPELSGALWLVCGAVAGLFAVLIVLVGARAQSPTTRSARRGTLARSGLDIALVVVAALGVSQLAMYGSPARGGQLDLVLALTPALALAAGAALTVRAVPAIGTLADRWLPGRPGLTAPLAVWNIARRPRGATGAVFLLTFAIAAATFAPGFISTWRLSQQDQADLTVGTDVRVDNVGTPVALQGVRIAAAADADPSPVARSRVALGVSGSAVAAQQRAELLAVDAAQPELLQGRAPGEPWASLLGPLTAPVVEGPPLPDAPVGVAITASGTLTPSSPSVTPADLSGSLLGTVTVMLRDARGAVWPVPLPSFPVDGTAHTVVADTIVDNGEPADDVSYPLTVESVITHVSLSPGFRFTEEMQFSQLEVEVASVSGVGTDGSTTGAPTAASQWNLAVPKDSVSAFADPALSVTPRGDNANQANLVTTAVLAGGDIDRSGADVILTPFAVPAEVPVAISSQLAAEVSTQVGGNFLISVPGGGAVNAHVTGISRYLPSLPNSPSILVDLDTFTRASIASGAGQSPMTGWQVSVPLARQSAVVATLRDTHLTPSTSRSTVTAELLDSPSRVGVQLAAVLVACAAITLGVAGFALHLSGSLDERRFELARLHGIGLSRRALAAAMMLEAAILAVVAGTFGLAIGALTNALVSKHLAVSESGDIPIPAPQTAWPWLAEFGVLGGVGIVLAVVTVTAARRSVARVRSDVLRLGGDS